MGGIVREEREKENSEKRTARREQRENSVKSER
jgi:hypothetical protein